MAVKTSGEQPVVPLTEKETRIFEPEMIAKPKSRKPNHGKGKTSKTENSPAKNPNQKRQESEKGNNTRSPTATNIKTKPRETADPKTPSNSNRFLVLEESKEADEETDIEIESAQIENPTGQSVIPLSIDQSLNQAPTQLPAHPAPEACFKP